MESERRGANEEKLLGELFGAYRAEWLGELLFELYAEPSYFPDLTKGSPCVLRGGRGTGKTTVLRGLSYDGRLALTKKGGDDILAWPYYGIYYRVDTNRVTAFTGPELSDDEWRPIFAHYFNLVMCDQVLRFLQWHELHTGRSAELGKDSIRKICIALNLDEEYQVNRILADALQDSLIRFEAYVNNVVDGGGPRLSMAGAPIDILFEAISRLPQFAGKRFFFLIDEYENFKDYQQQVVNTLIKHSGERYTFKIGIRELGWRVRTTVNVNEQLIAPADYLLVDIAERLEGDRFNQFALDVCRERLGRIPPYGGDSGQDIRNLLPGMTEDEEAERLGVRDLVEPTKAELLEQGVGGKDLEGLMPLQLYLIAFWADRSGRPVAEEFRDFLSSRRAWDVRYNNYKHALLYTLRRRKRGIRKFYEGWATFTQLAGSNIRYLLELVYESLSEHLRGGGTLNTPVPPDIQTRAAQRVGKENFTELEGLTVHGASLTKLVLGLGRVFGLMAAHPEGSTPEVNQFYLAGRMDQQTEEQVRRLLDAAVMHLALLRSSGTKLAGEGDTKDYDYFMHPIFAPFFVFSYRSKRKMALYGDDLLGLVSSPASAIRGILARSGRVPDEDLPEQLRLFETYFATSS